MRKELQQYINYVRHTIPDLIFHDLSLNHSKTKCFFLLYVDESKLDNSVRDNALLSRVYDAFRSYLLYIQVPIMDHISCKHDLRTTFIEKLNTDELFCSAILYIFGDLIRLTNNYENELLNKDIKKPNFAPISRKLNKIIKNRSSSQYPVHHCPVGINTELINHVLTEDFQDICVMLYNYIRPYCDRNMTLLSDNDLPHVYNTVCVLDAAIQSFLTSSSCIDE